MPDPIFIPIIFVASISEGQRFTTKLLTERTAARPGISPGPDLT